MACNNKKGANQNNRLAPFLLFRVFLMCFSSTKKGVIL